MTLEMTPGPMQMSPPGKMTMTPTTPTIVVTTAPMITRGGRTTSYPQFAPAVVAFVVAFVVLRSTPDLLGLVTTLEMR